MSNRFKKGDVLVNNSTQRYGCGALKLRKDAIVKANEDEDEYGDIRILRDKKAKGYDAFWVDARRMRIATSEEVEQFNAGVRTLTSVEIND